MGFFRNEVYGENRTIVFNQDVTQLQAIHAREIFPCFDQPDMKGTIKSSSILFIITIKWLTILEPLIEFNYLIFSKISDKYRPIAQSYKR